MEDVLPDLEPGLLLDVELRLRWMVVCPGRVLYLSLPRHRRELTAVTETEVRKNNWNFSSIFSYKGMRIPLIFF